VSRLEDVARGHGAYFTADELRDEVFPEPRWAVPGIVAEGLTLLAGPPKSGKSWLLLGLGWSVACGGMALGRLRVEPGEVLYCALEDTPRRLQDRLDKVLGPEAAPTRLHVVTMLPEMPQAIELLDEWLTEHPGTRLLIVDVLGKIRPAAGPQADRYEHDYKVIGALKRLADEHAVAVLVSTHTRKMGAEDVFDTVSGSVGLTGAADSTLVLRRARGETEGTLNVTGRDVPECEYALTFDAPSGSWSLLGSGLVEAAARAAQVRASAGLGDDSAAVVAYIAEHPLGVRAGDVAQHMGWPDTKTGSYLSRLLDAGRIVRPSRGLYAPVESVESVESGYDEDPGNSTLSTDYTPLFGSDS